MIDARPKPNRIKHIKLILDGDELKLYMVDTRGQVIDVLDHDGVRYMLETTGAAIITLPGLDGVARRRRR
jgi:hypothetical protein